MVATNSPISPTATAALPWTVTTTATVPTATGATCLDKVDIYSTTRLMAITARTMTCNTSSAIIITTSTNGDLIVFANATVSPTATAALTWTVTTTATVATTTGATCLDKVDIYLTTRLMAISACTMTNGDLIVSANATVSPTATAALTWTVTTTATVATITGDT